MSREGLVSDAELAATLERANAATPGPWATSVTDTNIMTITAPPNFMWMSEGAVLLEQDKRDMAFIAATREDVPKLVADLRAERAANARLRDALKAVAPTPTGYDRHCWCAVAVYTGNPTHREHSAACQQARAALAADGG